MTHIAIQETLEGQLMTPQPTSSIATFRRRLLRIHGTILTLVAFLLDSPYLRPIAWATTVIAVFAYNAAVRDEKLPRKPLPRAQAAGGAVEMAEARS